MARCKSCKKDKKHRNSTYFQTVKLPGERELPPHAKRRRDSYTVLDAFYYCHECIRNHWHVRKEIRKQLNRKDAETKVIREIPEIRNLDTDDGDDGGQPVPA